MKKLLLLLSIFSSILGIYFFTMKTKNPDIILSDGSIIEQGFGFSAAGLICFLICFIFFIISFFCKSKINT